MLQNIVKLHQVFAAPVEKVFKAFIDADAMASWLPPYGFVCKVIYQFSSKRPSEIHGLLYSLGFTNNPQFRTTQENVWFGVKAFLK